MGHRLTGLDSDITRQGVLSATASCFLEHLRAELGDPALRAEVGGRMDELLDGAQAAWPSLPDMRLALAERIGRTIPAGTDVLEALAELHVDDLYLACACEQGASAALAQFEQRYGEDLGRAHRRMGADAPAYDDFAQTLRQKLFVHDDPKIGHYAGQASLRSWLRVAAVRTLLNMKRGQAGRELAVDDERLGALPAPVDDPEIAYLKHHYREAFEKAFVDAAAALSPEERNVLRGHYAAGLSIDQLAATRGIHRATAARRVRSARERLLGETRRLLLERLKLARPELESVMRLIESQLHVTVERLLESRSD